MRWRNLESSGQVQDRRGTGRAVGGVVGGAGILGVLIVLLTNLLGGGAGFDQVDDLLGGMGGAEQAPQQQAAEFEGIDESEDFVRRVLGSTETAWGEIFSSVERNYNVPHLVLFEAATASGCGGANAAVGPHYCPVDETIYIDLDFFGEMQRRFGAGAAEFAQAYVIAHEVGHHVQNELDIMDEVQRLQRSDPGAANDLSVRLELQADCFAGVWAHTLYQRENVLEPGDIEDALAAAAAVGDDRIQQATTGQVNPESWTHGSADQRMEWFTQGYETGDANGCNTFG